MTKFEGIYTALLTPFDENGRINENALSDLIEYNLKLGANGFYCCGSGKRCGWTIVNKLDTKRRKELRVK